MIDYELENQIKSFEIDSFKNKNKELEAKRKDFIKRFSVSRIPSMSIDEYVIGKGKTENNFCYEIEHSLEDLGNIKSGFMTKFGIYFKKDDNKYIITKKWDKGSLDKSFEYLKSELIKLIEAGKINDINTIRKSPFSPMFKGKILSLNYPDKYLGVFSEAHLNHFLRSFNLHLTLKDKADIFDKRDKLVEFKDSHPVMKNWTLQMFANFLYNYYPKAPTKDSDDIEMPIGKVNMIDWNFRSVEIDENEDSQNPTKPSSTTNPDYIEAHKNQIKLGRRGEEIAMKYERQRLKDLGIKNQPKFVEDDSKGYDIESWNEDGSKRFIEVKTTQTDPDKKFHIYLTANELEKAKKEEIKENYHLYIVFHPFESNQEVSDMKNPFIEKDKIKLYHVLHKIFLEKDR